MPTEALNNEAEADAEHVAVSDLLNGISMFDGVDAASEARKAEREAGRRGESDPLEGLAERIRAAKNPEGVADPAELKAAVTRALALAHDPAVIAAAVELAVTDTMEFSILRSGIKAEGVALGLWDAAFGRAVREAKKAEKQAEMQAGAKRARERREGLVRERTAKAAARAAEREKERDEELALHYGEATKGDATYLMQPGCMTRMTLDKRGEEHIDTLASFSCVIRANVSELDTPTATPRSTLALSIVPERTGMAFALEIPADRFDRMEWPPRERGAVVMPDMREKTRATIAMLSTPTNTVRYGFTGLVEKDGETIYVHAGGAIGAAGALADIDAKVTHPGDRFALPAPFEGDALRRAAGAVLELLAVEPAHVMLPCVALAFRSVLGPCQFVVHIDGLKGVGKSLLTSLIQRFFGASMSPKKLPLSWRDSATVNGILGVLSTVGDCVVVADDLQPTPESLAKFGAVIGAVYNRASPVKRRRDGSARDPAPPRGSVISSGETLAEGPSLISRVLCVTLTEEPTPRLDSLDARASAGELAGFMAGFIRWYLPRAKDTRPKLAALDAEAARRWTLGETNRAAEILGALALGLSELFAFLEHVGVLDPFRPAALRARARDALLKAGGEYRENVERENDGRRFVELLGSGFRAGAAHVSGLTPTGEFINPESPGLWGYHRVGGEWQPRGPRIGYIARGEVALDLGAALRVARELAQRDGRPLNVDARGLLRQLDAAKLLARTGRDEGRDTLAARFRIGAGVRVSAIILDPSAFGVETVATDDGGDTEPE